MLTVGLIDDELGDLLQVIANLTSIDPTRERLRLVPMLVGTDSELVANTEAERVRGILESVLRSTGRDETISFPSIIRLGDLDLTDADASSRVLDMLADNSVDLIISDSWMGAKFAGAIMLDRAISDHRWASRGFQCWLMTKWEPIEAALWRQEWSGKFDAYAFHIDKNKVINSKVGDCSPQLQRVIEGALEATAAASRVSGLSQYGALLGRSPAMNGKNGVYERLEVSAASDDPVLITGSTGTGKELAADIVHKQGRRKNRPFVVVDCASIPAHLLESELFGYLPYAFTGASPKGKKGRLETAHSGTIFLDEIGDLSLELQPKLLRVLEKGEVMSLGAAQASRIDVRLIAATSRNLEKMVKEEKFREDLYYRIMGFNIRMPNLNERDGDIRFLATHFLREYNTEHDLSIRITEPALTILEAHQWPGNVRELQRRIKVACGFSAKSGFLLDETNAEIQKIQAECAHPNATPTNEAGGAPQTPVAATVRFSDMSAVDLWAVIKRQQRVGTLAEWAEEVGVPKVLEVVELVKAEYHGYPAEDELKRLFNCSYSAWKGWLSRNRRADSL